MRKLFVMFVLLGVLMPLTGSPARANGPYAPLIIAIRSNGELPSYYHDDLWLWDGTGEPRQLTSYLYNGAPIISPDNRYVAYLSTPKVFLQALKIGGGRSGVPPSNIWLMTIPDGDAIRIADQPKEAIVDEEAILSVGIERSQPTWSPDGTKLAWTEITELHNAPADEQRLMIYDLASGKTRTVITLPVYQIGSATPLWSEAGIALVANDVNGNSVVEIYDEQGHLISKQPFEGGDSDMRGVKGSDGKEYLGSRKSLIDSSTDTAQPIPASLALHSRTSAAGLFAEQRIGDDGNWTLHDGDMTQVIGSENYPVEWLAISPRGDAIAYVQHDDTSLALLVKLYQHGEITTIVTLSEIAAPRFIDGLAWGAIEWRVMP
ncbi:MAG: PD40 domain-containing protein [Anaerolineae bacterium]|nr:PD40 domain-containing protein [Anaerolineae bacterium]